jgi:hypothetical protein
MEAVERLQDEIHQLENSIREKERVLISRRREFASEDATLNDSEVALAEAEKVLAAAQEEFRAAELEKQSLVPQYERCQQNKDHHLRAAEYKKDIANAELQLRDADKKIRELEGQLKEVSATYKNERERRMLMLTRVTALVDDLRSSVEHKIALTLPIDDDDKCPSAQYCLSVLSELTRERDSAISHWSRYGRELAALVEMKKDRALELKLESEKDIGLMRAAKDEQIRTAIQKFDQERAAIIKDIEEMKQLNERQLQALRTPKMVSDKPGTIKGDAIGATQARKDFATPMSKLMHERSADLEREKQSLQDQIRDATAERQRLLTATKDLRRQLEAEDGKHTSIIRNIENQILNERNQIAALEKDNKRLKESCDHLAATLRSGYMIH